MKISESKVKTAQWTLNEARDKDGLDPIEGGDRPMVLTQSGYVPLDAFEQNQKTQQQNFQASLDAKSELAAQGGTPKDDKTDGANVGNDDKPAKKALGKGLRHPHVPFVRPIVARAATTYAAKIHVILQKTAQSVVEQLEAKKLAKNADDDVDNLDLDALEAMITASPEFLYTVGSDSGQQALVQIGVSNKSDLVNQVDSRTLAYARERAAEMVGKKWIDDELVDNPNAEWVITDATRDELRSIISSVYSGDLDPSELKDAILNAGAFSEERARLIARTELQAANAEGSLAGYKTARDYGVNVKKAWHPDANACDECLDNADDGAIDLDDSFSTGDDAPPAHPNCECVLVPVVGSDDEE